MTVSAKSPTPGDVLTYTLTVRNTAANAADSVEVTDRVPSLGVDYLSATLVRGGKTWSYAAGTGRWNVGTLAANDSAQLTIQVRVTSPGVWFNQAFVSKQKQPDVDSTPGNEVITEDDYANACFSVPVMLYPDEELTVSLPVGIGATTWMKDSVAITASTPTTTAVANPNGSLTIRTPGTYRFTTSIGNCPAGGCCPIVVIPGQYGSIGGIAWKDFNGDGLRNPGLDGIAGLTTRLFDSTGTTVVKTMLTNEKGLYQFDSLRNGAYVVEFVKPALFESTPMHAGSDPTKDSDADPVTGRTQKIRIDVSRPAGDLARHNGTIDVGYTPAVVNVAMGSIGGMVWKDYNGDGIRNPGLDGVVGATVRLLDSTGTTVLKTRLTNAQGRYLFDSLARGRYVAEFFKPAGMTTSPARAIVDSTKNSQPDPNTGRTGLIAIDPTKSAGNAGRDNLNVNAGFMPPCENPQATALLAEQTICPGDTASLASYAVKVNGTTEYIYQQWFGASATKGVLGTPLWGFTATSFRPTAAQLPPADGKTYYYAVMVQRYALATCADTLWMAMTVKAQAAKPTVAAVPLTCQDGSVSLVATSPGSSIRWFASAKSTTPSATVNSGQAFGVVADSSRSYFAEAVAAGGCVSARTEVFVGVNQKPAKPASLSALANACPDSTVNLAASARALKLSQPGNAFEWHTGSSATSAGVTDSLVRKTTTLYLFEKSPEGCFSEPQAVNVTIAACDCAAQVAMTLTVPADVCGGAFATTATATLAGKPLTGLWSSTGSGTFASISDFNTTYLPSKADSLAGKVTITFTTIDPDGGGSCQSVAKSAVVNITGAAAAPKVTADTTVCAGTTLQLAGKAKPGATINWYTTASGGTPVGTHPSGGFLAVKPAQTTTYYAEAVSGTCASSQRTAVKVTTQTCPEPTIDLSLVKQVSDPSPVVGDTVTYTLEVKNSGQLTATGIEVRDVLPKGLQFVSSTSLTKADSVLTGTLASLDAGKVYQFAFKAKVTGDKRITNSAQLFKATEKDVDSTPGNGYANGEDDESSVSLTPRTTCTPKAPVLSAAKTTVAPNECVLLTATGCETGLVQWSTGGSGQTLTVCPAKTTTYTATCTVKGCTSDASVGVTVTVVTMEAPVVKAAATTVCNTGTTLSATGCAAGTIQWSDGQTGTSITVKPLSATTYSAVCNVGGQLSATSNLVTITVATPAVPIVGATATDICPGASTLLTAYGCTGTVTWSSGEVGASLTVSPTKTTTYTATCTVGECTSTKSNQLVVNVLSGAVPTIAASATSLCANASITLTATGCSGGVQWSNGLSGYVVTVNEPGSYSAKCVGAGCTSEFSKPIVIKSGAGAAAPTLTASKAEVCFGESVTLTAAGCTGGTVTWSNGKSGLSLTVTPDSTRNFTATCTLDGCTSPASTSLKVVVNKAATPVLTASKTSVEKGGSVVLTAKGCENGVVTWNNIHEGNPFTVTPAETTTYTATCTVGSCVSDLSQPLTITVKCVTLPTAPTLTASQNPVLKGESVVLTAKGCANGTLTWNTGDTGDSLKLTPAATASYTATCTVDGCTSLRSDTLTVAVVDCLPVKAPVVVARNNATLCAGESATLLVHNCAGTVTWSTGATGDSLVVSPLVTTTYTATCTVGKCKSPISNEQLVTVIAPVVPVVTASEDSVKTGTSVTLTAAGCNGTVIWSNGAIGASLIVKITADSAFTARCAVDRCTSKPSNVQKIKVVAGPDCKTPPTLSATKTTICRGESVTLTAAGCPTGTVVWNGVYAGNPFTVSLTETTTYTATCSIDGCTSALSEGLTIAVDKPAAPTLLVANPTNACPVPTVDLTKTVSNGGAGEIQFYLGVTIGSLKVAKPDSVGAGTYYAFVKSANGCFSDPTAAIVVTLAPCAPPKLPTQLAIAKALTDTTRRPDGSYDVTYSLKIKNLGNTPLKGFILRDSLTKTFPNLPFSVVDGSVETTGLTPNQGFNGRLDPVVASADSLAAGGTETVKFTVNVAFGQPALGIFHNLAVGTATAADGSAVIDWSNNGPDPAPDTDSPTPLAFGLAGTRLGIAKHVLGAPVKVGDRLYKITYEIRATNYGRKDMVKVRLSDDLAAAFTAKGAVVDSVQVSADAGFAANATFNGSSETNLLVDSLSTLPVGATRTVYLKLRVDLAAATDSVFHNTALGKGWDDNGDTSEDASTLGLDPDPDADADPTNNSVPTDVTLKLRLAAQRNPLGLAMRADTARQADGSYRVAYTLTLRNYGDLPLTNLQVSDSLARVFTGTVSYAVVGQPAAGSGSSLVVNPNFNGDGEPNLLVAERSALAARQTALLRFTLNVVPDGRTEPFLNSAYATAFFDDTTKVFDTSTNGLDPAPNGLPSLAYEPTPVTLPVSGDASVFIPEGFSPNGDGVNDRFVIRNTAGATVSLQVFNRWGQVVFASEDYKNDWGGAANRGAAFGASGLPDGTYYYLVRLSDGRQFTRYMTIMR